MLLLPYTHNPLQTAAPLVPSWERAGILFAALMTYDSMQLPWLKMHQPWYMTTTCPREMLATTADALRCYFSCIIVPASVSNHWRLSFSSLVPLCKLPLSFVTYIHLVLGLEKLTLSTKKAAIVCKYQSCDSSQLFGGNKNAPTDPAMKARRVLTTVEKALSIVSLWKNKNWTNKQLLFKVCRGEKGKRRNNCK